MAGSPIVLSTPGQDPYGPAGLSPFPELPRADCNYTPTVARIQKPMLPKPKWAGASSYDDPAYPHGGGPDDVPVAPPSIGQATPAAITPPIPPAAGGAGAELSIAQATEDGDDGQVKAKAVKFKVDLSASPNFEQTGDEFSAKYFKL